MYLQNPKISIVIPTYNQGHFIEETILSIINQSYKNVEIIVIDGASSDNTKEIIKKYKLHFAYWVSEPDAGQSEAINKGLKIATGEIVTWLNSDDTYEPQALENVASLFSKNPQAAFIHGRATLFGRDIRSKTIGLSEDIKLSEYLPYMRFPQPASFFKKNILDQIGEVNNQLHYAMDFELVVRIILLGGKPLRTDLVFSNYRIHKNSKSNHDLKFLSEWATVVYCMFCSVQGGAGFADELNNLGLLDSFDKKQYTTQLFLETHCLQAVFLEHLHLQYHYRYRNYDYDMCKKISAYLNNNYPTFYNIKKFKRYNLRLKFIPNFAFRLSRKFRS